MLPEGQQATPPIWQAQKWGRRSSNTAKSRLTGRQGKGRTRNGSAEVLAEQDGDTLAEEAQVIANKNVRHLRFQKQQT